MAQPTDHDMQRLRDRHVQFETSFNSHDYTSCLDMYADDIVIMMPGGNLIEDKQGIMQMYQTMNQIIPGSDNFKMVDVTVPDLVMTSPEYAFSRIHWTFVSKDPTVTMAPIYRSGLVIWKKIKGDWYVYRSMDN